MTPTLADEQLVQGAYRSCEALTRNAAANFYYGIRLLPACKRRAMCAVYAFARQIDDIGDGDEPLERKFELLAAARSELEHDGAKSTPMRLALADAERRFKLPREALSDLIAGVEMDLGGERYETFDELVVYCRRVAGSVGRLCLSIFGSRDIAAAMPLADDLGVAMQITNILRDVREDLTLQRIYLPAQDRERFGCGDLTNVAPPQFASLIQFEVVRAREWFDHGLQLLDLIDARSGSCVLAMTGIYRRLLERIDETPMAVLDSRLRLATWEKSWVAVRSLAGASGVFGAAKVRELSGAVRR